MENSINGKEKLYEALAKAQGEFEPIEKDKQVKVTMKSGGVYYFKYATYDSVLSATKKALAKNGLCLFHRISDKNEKEVLISTLAHSSGQETEATKVIPPNPDPQQYGAFITYFKRYQTNNLLGVSADEDNDANEIEQTKTQSFTQEKPPAQQAPKQKEHLASFKQIEVIKKLRANLKITGRKEPEKMSMKEASAEIEELNKFAKEPKKEEQQIPGYDTENIPF